LRSQLIRLYLGLIASSFTIVEEMPIWARDSRTTKPAPLTEELYQKIKNYVPDYTNQEMLKEQLDELYFTQSDKDEEEDISQKESEEELVDPKNPVMRIDEALNIFNLPALPANKKYTIKEVMERADHLLSANKGSLDTNIKN